MHPRTRAPITALVCSLGRGAVVWSALTSAVHQSVGSPADWVVACATYLGGWLVRWVVNQSATSSSSVVSWLKDRDSPHPYQGESRYSTIQKKLTGFSIAVVGSVRLTNCPLNRVRRQISTLLHSRTTYSPSPLFHSAIPIPP